MDKHTAASTASSHAHQTMSAVHQALYHAGIRSPHAADAQHASERAIAHAKAGRHFEAGLSHQMAVSHLGKVARAHKDRADVHDAATHAIKKHHQAHVSHAGVATNLRPNLGNRPQKPEKPPMLAEVAKGMAGRIGAHLESVLR